MADWRGGRVVERARLEIECAERHRGFESHPLRFAVIRFAIICNQRSDAIKNLSIDEQAMAILNEW